MGPQIVSKAVMLVWTNLGAAIRATAVPFALLAAVPGLLLQAGLGEPPNPRTLEVPEISFAPILLALVIAPLLFAWAAAAWHRYILLQEEPFILPAPGLAPLLGYVWAFARVGLIAAVVGLAVAIPAGALMAGLGAALGPGTAWLVGLIGFGVWVVLSYGVLRFSLVLPAAAVGRGMSLGGSWAATGRARDAVLVTALLSGLLQFVLQSVGGALALAGLPGLALSLVLTWASAMIGLSILTALYGVLVEGRSVD